MVQLRDGGIRLVNRVLPMIDGLGELYIYHVLLLYIYQFVSLGILTSHVLFSSSYTQTHIILIYSFEANTEQDYMNIVTTKWHSGGYRMDCVDKGSHTGWQCAAMCPYPIFNPNFMEWGYLTFEARVLNKDGLDDGMCKPRVKVTKRWPSYSSNNIVLEGEYVDGGKMVETEWKRVVIPTGKFERGRERDFIGKSICICKDFAHLFSNHSYLCTQISSVHSGDFATSEWPSVNGVKDLYFLVSKAAHMICISLQKLKFLTERTYSLSLSLSKCSTLTRIVAQTTQ